MKFINSSYKKDAFTVTFLIKSSMSTFSIQTPLSQQAKKEDTPFQIVGLQDNEM